MTKEEYARRAKILGYSDDDIEDIWEELLDTQKDWGGELTDKEVETFFLMPKAENLP